MESSAEPGRAAPTVTGPYEPNAILRWFYARFFARIAVDERWSEVVSAAAARGVVVYVLRSVSFLDFHCLDFLVNRFGLPIVRFVNDLGLWILEPFGKGGRRLRLKRQIPEDRAILETVQAGHSAALFLRRPPNFGSTRRKPRALEVDLLAKLVEAQRGLELPILLVPQTFVWSKLPPNRRRTLWDALFGPSEWPGTVRVFFQFLFNYRNALLRSGEPFDLAEFVAEHQDLTDTQIADKIRWALTRRLERERTLVLGPSQKSAERLTDEILRSPRVRSQIEAAAKGKRTLAGAEREARKILRQLRATPALWMMLPLKRLLDRVWNRIYDGMVVDLEGLERVREAARNGNLVLLPSHKSHVDYLVLSDVLFSHALSPPLVAAGDNLSFWPLGWVLRHAGAFFIRRSFRGNKLYPSIVDAYLRKLMLEGYSIEFFVEGGRSRTGKLLPPKVGLLSMVIDAALALRGRKVHFVPISIGYERIIEEGSYVAELGGGEKEKENIGGLLQTPRVLRSRYGRLYIQFGQILSMDALLTETASLRKGARAAATQDSSLSPSERRALVQRVAHRVTYEINRVTVVTPAALVATALLVHRRRGMTHRDLLETSRLLLDALRTHAARVPPALVAEDGTVRPDIIGEATRLFEDAKLVVSHGTGADAIYAVPEERRLALEYYENSILHFFVPSALIGSALIAAGPEPVSEHALRERVQALSRIFKFEFMYRADASFDEIFRDALRKMIDEDELEQMADHLRPAASRAGARVPVYASMIRTYFECHLLAVRATETLATWPLSRKEWGKRALALGQRMYLAGELELRESLSRTKLDNALSSLRDLGYVSFGDDDMLVRGEALTSVDTLREYARTMARYLR